MCCNYYMVKPKCIKIISIMRICTLITIQLLVLFPVINQKKHKRVRCVHVFDWYCILLAWTSILIAKCVCGVIFFIIITDN